MAEVAFATLGASASILQVIDFGLRLSREAYTFLHEVKGSRKDIEILSRTIGGATSVLLDLKVYVEEQRRGGNVIPEAISYGAYRLQEILIDIRNLLPDDYTDMSLYKRIKWVTDSKRLRQLSQQLENEKSTLQLALLFAFQREIKGQYRLLRAPVVEQQHLDGSVSAGPIEQPLILSEISESRTILNDSIVAQSQSILSFQRTAQSRIESRLRNIEENRTGEEQSPQKIAEEIEKLKEDLHKKYLRFDKRFDHLEALERTTTIADNGNCFSQDTLSRIIRAELRNILDSIAADAVGSDQWKRERASRRSNAIGDEVGQSMQIDDEAPDQGQAAATTPGKRVFHSYPLILDQTKVIKRHYRLKKRIWRYNWLFGLLIVQVTKFERLGEFSNSRTITVTVTFLPSLRVPLRGISAALRLSANHAGYQEIGPSLRVMNIVPKDALIWRCIESGDLPKIRLLFKSRLASPTDTDPDGNTLLHVAGKYFKPDICQFLSSEGADPLATNSDGNSPLDNAHYALLQSAMTAIVVEENPDCLVQLVDTCRILETNHYQFSDSMTEMILPRSFPGFKAIANERPEPSNPPSLRNMLRWIIFFRQRYPEIEAGNGYNSVSDFMCGAWNTNFASLIILYLGIATGMDVNCQFPEYGWTALHFTLSAGGEMEPFDFLLLKIKLRLLIACGADFSIRTTAGDSAFYWAEISGVIKPLLEVLDEFGLLTSDDEDDEEEDDEEEDDEEEEGFSADTGISTTIEQQDLQKAGEGLRSRRLYVQESEFNS